MPPLDPAQSLKLHREAAHAVRISAAAESCQEAKDRAVQYARIACALKQEARKLEKQAEQFLEDAAAERKKSKGITTRCMTLARQWPRKGGRAPAPSLPRSQSARSGCPTRSDAARSLGSVGCDACACVPTPCNSRRMYSREDILAGRKPKKYKRFHRNSITANC